MTRIIGNFGLVTPMWESARQQTQGAVEMKLQGYVDNGPYAVIRAQTYRPIRFVIKSGILRELRR